MAHASIRRNVDAPIERVWQLGTDLRRWPTWLEGLLEIGEVSGPDDQVGTTAVLVLKGPDGIHRLRLEVVTVDRPRMHAHVAAEIGGGMSYRSTIRLAEATGGGTDFTWEQDITAAPGLLRALADRFLVRRMSERQMATSCDRFASLLRQGEATVGA